MEKFVMKMMAVALVAVMLGGCSSDTKTATVVKPGNKPLVATASQKLLVPNHEGYQPVDQIKAYYEQWKNGNHFDKAGNRVEAPGYVQGFELPVDFKLPWEDKGSQMGAVVVMVPNGTADELPGEYCVSTDEAMGYGMILAALMDDRALFDDLYRVVDYYDNYSADRIGGAVAEWQPNLTSWAIPAKKGADWFETDYFKGLDPAVQSEWQETGVRYQPLYKENTDIKESVIIGEPLTPENASGSAMDGELDIAYALYLAHTQWESGDEHMFLDLAKARFKAIIDVMVEPYGKIERTVGEETIFLPTGDFFYGYNDGQNDVERGLTRPCDWMNAELRTYALHSGDSRALELIENNYTFSDELADPTTGFVPDFAMWVPNGEGKLVLVPAPDDIANEWMTEYFYMNSSRYLFRQAMDYQHYGDKRGIENALKIVDFMITTYGFKTEADFQAYPPAIHSLDGVAHEDGLWTNPVLNAGLYASASASGDPKYQAFVNMGWDDLANNFNSRYDDYDQNGLGLDPMHSGYFSDTWRLMAMLSMSGNWFVPE